MCRNVAYPTVHLTTSADVCVSDLSTLEEATLIFISTDDMLVSPKFPTPIECVLTIAMASGEHAIHGIPAILNIPHSWMASTKAFLANDRRAGFSFIVLRIMCLVDLAEENQDPTNSFMIWGPVFSIDTLSRRCRFDICLDSSKTP